MDVKNEVLVRIYSILFGIIIPVAFLLIYRTVQIAVFEGEEWRQKGKERYIQPRVIEADRGNIMAQDGALLATSIPFFDIFFDPLAPTNNDFDKNVDTLSKALARYIREFPANEYYNLLQEWRKGTKRFIPIAKNVPYAQKELLENLPLFNLGQNRGGFIAQKRSTRKRPFGLLAFRTIGYSRGDRKVGIEGSFDDILGGKPGQQQMILVDRANDIWMPLQNLTEIEPQNGMDIVTTLDVNIQDISETALMRAMLAHEPDWGTAIVMDVKTGAIKAIANLGREDDKSYFERYNYAIASSTEPGSTFKLASIMALLEDGYVNLTDSIDIERGVTTFYDEIMEDSNEEHSQIDSMSVRTIFEKSSNVGMAKLINHFYGTKNKRNQNLGAEKYINRIKAFNLNLPTNVELEGEAAPYIKEAYSEKDLWSGTTLPWMAIGYEVQLTPLQTLTFFNAVANNGTIMKPYLVSEVQKFGETMEVFKPTVVKKKIASNSTLKYARELLEGVVDSGTAAKLKTEDYNFAGKTGTAQINYQRFASGTRVGGYQASFAGYFPAENPVYSCIVVIYNPRQAGYYGADVAGPVFREIADKVFSSKTDLHAPLNTLPKPKLVARQLPNMDIGYREDLKFVLNELNIQYYGNPESEFGVLDSRNDSVTILDRRIIENLVPNVVGMGLRDALYALENQGLKVQVNGFGKVVNQSIAPGTRVRGQQIKITLD